MKEQVTCLIAIRPRKAIINSSSFHFAFLQNRTDAIANALFIIQLYMVRWQTNVWRKPPVKIIHCFIVSSPGGIGKKSTCNWKTLEKNLVKKSVKYLFRVKIRGKKRILYLKNGSILELEENNW